MLEEEALMQLFTRMIGESGPLVVYCHGLFGQGKNWTSVAKALTPAYRGLLVDMPNHGRSDRDDIVTYDRMADALAAMLRAEHAADLPVTLVGHSMGGKVVMRVALRYPELVGRLVVVDMSPANTGRLGNNDVLIAAMQALDLDTLGSREEADERLATDVPDPVVRHFLMQNLRREKHGWHWQMNLPVLAAQREALLDWDHVDGRFDGPVLWVAGEKSDYVRPQDTRTMRALFPSAVKITIKGAGHWVHTEQPDAFIRTLREFLERTEPEA